MISLCLLLIGSEQFIGIEVDLFLTLLVEVEVKLYELQYSLCVKEQIKMFVSEMYVFVL